MAHIPDVVLVGHPFAPIGRGEDVRSSYRALRSIAVPAKVLDVYGPQEPQEQELHAHIAADAKFELGRVNIFHINGDEVPQVMRHLAGLKWTGSYNIVYPAWELASYPSQWARSLDRFDEIWAPTRFIFESLAPVVGKPLRLVPLASEVILEDFYCRRYFNIPESAYAFLFSFDFRSFLARKNPEAVLTSFERLMRDVPDSDAVLVIKMHGPKDSVAARSPLWRRIEDLGPRAMVIDHTMSDSEMRNLIRVCDCYVSLHRSEGFGRGLAEAMYLEKPVIATGYSGNLDFMAPEDSVLVDARIIDVKAGEYPFWEGQRWADPDIDQAVQGMRRLLEDRRWGCELGREAAVAVRKRVGFRVSGMRYWKIIREILADTS